MRDRSVNLMQGLSDSGSVDFFFRCCWFGGIRVELQNLYATRESKGEV